ncbi:endoplasmic reticulum metallopeptidase 1-like [Culex pipiens pallens]|uniref:endoplasmic reticulum metallopeptidase 1-like n=1 Tax=Culex pipiens pallens TaxID=42434 RepID=UPI001953F408|nr:endoplasmic reticulum metallopeptidase 1-like [Culex pipiens pallens]
MFKSYRKRLRLKSDRAAEQDESYGQTISVLWSFAITAAVIGLYFLVYLNWVTLPTALTTSDQAGNPGRFIAQVAKENLVTLTSNGPRVGGGQTNEVFTVNFLRSTIENIIAEANPVHKFELEVQQQRGSMLFDYISYPMTSAYQGVQNVLVKITPATGPEPQHYLMLSSHFDSVAQSPGAGDDGTMTVVMLEVLRQLSLDSTAYQHGVVFVFNGFEENGLQGAHAFVLHPWWDRVRTFINMDVAANGGREIMFQAGPYYSFLMEYYRDYVKHPFCTALAEELFQADLVPSETDYFVYTKVGGRPGMDFAHSTWGYLYHTQYDAIDTIPMETLQHTGDNILGLTRALANAPELENMKEHSYDKAVFFDFLNWFLVYYPDWAGIAINTLMAMLGIGLIFGSFDIMASDNDVTYGRIVAQFFINFGVQLLSIAVGIGFSILMAVIMNAAGGAMSWFTEVWLISGLYMCPFIICTVLGPVLLIMFYKVEDVLLQTRIMLFLMAQQMIFIVIMMVMTGMEIRSAYIFAIVVIFFNASTIVNMIIRFKQFHWIYVHLIGQIIPIAYFSSFSLTVFSTFIPMQNRGNAESNPDMLIALFAVVIGLMITTFLTPLVAMMRKPFVYFGFVVAFWAISIIVSVTPVGFPYRAETSPQRYYVFHLDRNFYEFDGRLRKSDSHFYIHPQDVFSPATIMDTVPEMARATQLGDECDRELYCGIPFYQSGFHARRNVAWWLPAEKPDLKPKVTLEFVGKTAIDADLTRYEFVTQGPSHMSFYVSPLEGYYLYKWSFSSEVPRSGVRWRGQDVHFVNFVHGIDYSPLRFWVVIMHPAGKPLTEPSLILNVVGQYMNNEEPRTAEFQQFVDHFPDYAHVVAYPSYLESRVF